MNQLNCVVDVERLTGDEDSKTYEPFAQDVRILAVAASNDIAVLYSDVPVGTLYSVLFFNSVQDIKPGDKLIVKSPLTSGLNIDDKLFISGEVRKINMFGQCLVEGVAVRT